MKIGPIENIVQRLRLSVNYLKTLSVISSQEDVAVKLGYSRAHTTKAINGVPRYLTDNFVARFAKAYSEYIRPEWLIDGTGPMTPQELQTSRPHIPAEIASVAAGTLSDMADSVKNDDTELRARILEFNNYDFTIFVSGDSMLPVLHHGDTIALRRLDADEPILPNRIYAIDTRNGAVVKQLTTSRNDIVAFMDKEGYDLNPDEYIIAHSLNPDYNDYPIAKADIITVYQVVGSLHRL